MKFKKVLLISARFYKGIHRLSITPVAGLGYISHALLGSGIETSVFDMNLQYDFAQLVKRISEYKPDLIGFSVMTFGHKEAYQNITRIKKIFHNITVIVGGPHVSTLRERVLKDCPGIDYGAVLEGDRTILDLCSGKDHANIQGLIYRKGNEIIYNKYLDFIQDLDKVGYPKYEAFELAKYPTRQIGIVTSRGCPYNCIYCPVITAIGRKFRFRSASSVVEEIEYWYNRGFREILILDDNFTLLKKRVNEICDLLTQKQLPGISLKCPNGIRADMVDHALLKKMKEVGFDKIAFGVEAGNDKILANIKKGESIATIEKSISDACQLGFDVDLFFILGSPGETISDINDSFALALRYPVSSAKFYNIVPFPTTELFNWIQKNNYFLHDPEDILNNASHFVNEPAFFTPELSAQQRKDVFRQASKITRKIRRNYIERRVKLPKFFAKAFSMAFTNPFVEDTLLTNIIFVKFKEAVKYLTLGKNK
ncbi:MAG: hypothetical protein A2251_05195 [Elusimicrobia bacterium RIFOXYA2_FULL_47_53]|nr:MAG: hypothetical protein A2278_01745 [Elusimicrobia bacterium RIFOXYA12_FULL_49_49]OGS11661.1 MAG: hypothetical protein A2386_03285 [Elusimicrobia bacterium RIFOXYB1_FULL_48_9]OGS16772.1 MAG: hypothetical protein A2251_05195 [Elusimicrobia bacterium RIFOXYA2_FULL_47_53]OGS32000.1 MAG: hypothetical protein A2323_07970 [Elusimicrobia bacterium RIFOXYB2_FULL_46_23]